MTRHPIENSIIEEKKSLKNVENLLRYRIDVEKNRVSRTTSFKTHKRNEYFYFL